MAHLLGELRHVAGQDRGEDLSDDRRVGLVDHADGHARDMIRQVRVHRQDTRVVPPLDVALRLFEKVALQPLK